MVKPINYNTFKLLNNYDLLNKFNFKSVYEFPIYDKIELKTFIKDSSLGKITQLQIESFFFYYILGLTNTFLKFKYIAQSAGYLRSVLIESEMKSIVLKHLILDFLFNFYLILNKTSRSCTTSESFLIFSKTSGKPLYKKFNLISYFSGDLLVEKREQKLINFNDLKVFICFTLIQPILYYYKNNKKFNFNLFFFKNIFPFWTLT